MKKLSWFALGFAAFILLGATFTHEGFLRLGDGSNVDQEIEFDQGQGSSNAKITADSSDQKLSVSTGIKDTAIEDADIDLGTASDSNRITLPKAAKASLDGLTRKEGNLFYSSDDDRVYADDGTNLVEIGSGSGTGKNYVENPSGASDQASVQPEGWTESTDGEVDITKTDTASELPREHSSESGLKIVGTGTVDATDEYVAYDFDLDDADFGYKLRIQMAIKPLSGYADDELAVVIYDKDNSTEITPSVTNIKNADYVFEAAFDAPSTQNLELRIKSAGTSTSGVVVSDVLVGPGTVVNGAVVSEGVTPTSGQTPSLANLPGTMHATRKTLYRTGDRAFINGQFSASGAGTGDITGSFGSDLSFNTAAESVYNGQNIGKAKARDDSTGNEYVGTVIALTAGPTFIIRGPDGQGTWNASVPFTWASGDSINFELEYPVSQWSGSGTVNLGQNSPTFVSHDGSNIVYGQDGAEIPTSTPSGGSETYDISAGFSDVQASDQFVLEVDSGGNGVWIALPSATIEALQRDTTNFYGAGVDTDSAGNVRIVQGKYRRNVGSTDAWSGVVAGTSWRVRRIRAGDAVGFGAATSEQRGLVQYSYQELDLSSQGDFNSGLSSLPVRISRVNEQVTLSWGSVGHTSSANPNTGSGFIPAEFRPAEIVRNVYEAGSSQIFKVSVQTDGTLQFDYRNYTGSASARTTSGQGTLSYTIDQT